MSMSIENIARGFVTSMIYNGGGRSARVYGNYALSRNRSNIRATVNAFETVATRESDGTVVLLSNPAFGVATRFESAIATACEDLDVSVVYDTTVELKVATSFQALCDGMRDGQPRRGLDIFAARLVLDVSWGAAFAEEFAGPLSALEHATLRAYSAARLSACWHSRANCKAASGMSLRCALRWATVRQRCRRART